MQQAPWTVRSADWPVTSKMTLALIAKDIGKSSSYFESLASVLSNKKAAPSNCFCMSCLYHIPMLPAAIPVIAFLIGMSRAGGLC